MKSYDYGLDFEEGFLVVMNDPNGCVNDWNYADNTRYTIGRRGRGDKWDGEGDEKIRERGQIKMLIKR